MQLEQVGDHCYAVINPRNRLCDSNSGLVNAGGGLVIDTQCDLAHARRMIELFGKVWPAMPRRVAITHEDCDHVWGNQLFADAEIIAQRKIRERMPHTADPRNLQRLQAAERGWLGRMVLRISNRAMLEVARQLAGEYDFDGVELVLPTALFDERYELHLDGIEVHLIHVGPSHQWGDTLVHVPSQRVLFAGDVLFRQCTPMGWAGTFQNWQRSLDLIIELAPEVIVPGHGPVCGLAGPRELKAYLDYVYAEARKCFDRGWPETEAARRIDLGPYAAWNAPARLYFNVARAYREFRGEPHDAPWNIGKAFAATYAVARARGIEPVF
jgi:glyoxylase-like metal-dependent hydrolase (beta-lactamase superfamily II)